MSRASWGVWSVGLFIPKEDLTAGAHHTVSIMAGDHRRGDEGKLVPPNKDVSARSQDFLPLSLRSWFWFPNDLRFVKTGKWWGQSLSCSSEYLSLPRSDLREVPCHLCSLPGPPPALPPPPALGLSSLWDHLHRTRGLTQAPRPRCVLPLPRSVQHLLFQAVLPFLSLPSAPLLPWMQHLCRCHWVAALCSPWRLNARGRGARGAPTAPLSRVRGVQST